MEADAEPRLASKRRAQKTKGIEVMVHRLKLRRHACECETARLSRWRGAGLFGIKIKLEVSRDGTRRLKLLAQPAPGGPWTKSSLDTKDSPVQDRHVANTMLGLNQCLTVMHGEGRERLYTRGCDDDECREGTRRESGMYNAIRLLARHLPAYCPPSVEW